MDGERNYTTKDMAALYDDAGVPNGRQLIEATTKPNLHFYPPLDVDFVCVYGYNLSTPVLATFNSGNWSVPSSIAVGNGDATVPLDGLTTVCESLNATMVPIVNMKHSDAMHDDRAWAPLFDMLGV